MSRRTARTRFPRAPEAAERPRPVGVGEQQQELVAAVARGEIACAQRAHEDLAHGCERLVAELMTVKVVDLLEVIVVDDHDRERDDGPAGMRREPLERLIGGAAVGELGQRVACGASFGEREIRRHRRQSGRTPRSGRFGRWPW